MNMLDDNETFHVTREGYSHLSDVEWEAVTRMGSVLGETAMGAMLDSLDRTASMQP